MATTTLAALSSKAATIAALQNVIGPKVIWVRTMSSIVDFGRAKEFGAPGKSEFSTMVVSTFGPKKPEIYRLRVLKTLPNR